MVTSLYQHCGCDHIEAYNRLDDTIFISSSKPDKMSAGVVLSQPANQQRAVIDRHILHSGSVPQRIYEGHPINSGNFLIIKEYIPFKHHKCNH